MPCLCIRRKTTDTQTDRQTVCVLSHMRVFGVLQCLGKAPISSSRRVSKASQTQTPTSPSHTSILLVEAITKLNSHPRADMVHAPAAGLAHRRPLLKESIRKGSLPKFSTQHLLLSRSRVQGSIALMGWGGFSGMGGLWEKVARDAVCTSNVFTFFCQPQSKSCKMCSIRDTFPDVGFCRRVNAAQHLLTREGCWRS